MKLPDSTVKSIRLQPQFVHGAGGGDFTGTPAFTDGPKLLLVYIHRLPPFVFALGLRNFNAYREFYNILSVIKRLPEMRRQLKHLAEKVDSLKKE